MIVYSDDQLLALIRAAINEHVLPAPEIQFNLDTPLSEIGLSHENFTHESRSFLNLTETINSLEMSLKIYISDDDYDNLLTVQDILNALKKELANSESEKESEKN